MYRRPAPTGSPRTAPALWPPLFETPKPRALDGADHPHRHQPWRPGARRLRRFRNHSRCGATRWGRPWIAVELRGATIDTFARPRLEQVVAGTDQGGVTTDVGWEGGGGFAFAQVGPSMFEDVGGVIVLASGPRAAAPSPRPSPPRLATPARPTCRSWGDEGGAALP